MTGNNVRILGQFTASSQPWLMWRPILHRVFNVYVQTFVYACIAASPPSHSSSVSMTCWIWVFVNLAPECTRVRWLQRLVSKQSVGLEATNVTLLYSWSLRAVARSPCWKASSSTHSRVSCSAVSSLLHGLMQEDSSAQLLHDIKGPKKAF